MHGELGQVFGDKCCEAKLKSTSKADGLPREEYRGSLWVRSDGKQLSTSGHAGLLS